MEDKKLPWIVYAESTPNPTTMKYVVNRLLIENGQAVEYKDADEVGSNSPLAQSLFRFPFVKGIFVSSNYIAVTKDESVGWEDIANELRVFIKEFLDSGQKVVKLSHSTEQSAENSEVVNTVSGNEVVGHADAKTDADRTIIKVLDDYIRPAVEQDGGLINFKSFEEGIVTVQLRGACSGCPSSTMTLKGGIEQLLKKELPNEVKEVVAEEL